MTLNDYVPLIFRRLRPQSRPNEATSLITQLAQKYGLENIGEIDEQFLNGFTCASDIVIAQLEKEFESDNKGEWIDISTGKGIFKDRSVKCSNCRNTLNLDGVNCGRGDANFCPNCGADMRGKADE